MSIKKIQTKSVNNKAINKNHRRGLWFFGKRCYKPMDCIRHTSTYIFRKIKAIRHYFAIRKSTEPIEHIRVFKVPIVENRKPRTTKSEIDGFKQLVLPIYFGWEIVIRHRPDWSKRVIRPFRTYWQYVTTVVVLIIFVSTTIFINQYGFSEAATYNFVQTDWSGGVTANNAAHSSNRTGWTEYISKDSNITAGTEVTIAEAVTTLTETSDTDFDAGATSTAAVTGSGDSAYVVLDVSSGSNGLINNAGASEYAYDVAVSGNYAYVANGTGGLFIYDITDPSSPSYVSDIDNGSASKVVVYGDYVYLADTAHLDIVDVSTKLSPSLGTAINVTGGPRDIIIDGSTLYVSWSTGDGYSADGWIRAYSLSDPAIPSQTAITSNQGQWIEGMVLSGDYLYASQEFWEGPYTLEWYDISTPGSITSVNNTTATNYVVKDVAVYGEYVYMANDVDGVHVFATTTDSRPYTYNTAGNATGLALNGTTLYVADNNTSVLDLDISDPSSISQNTTYTATDAQGVTFSSPYLYIADYSSGLRTVAIPSYLSPGTFTSQTLDTTANSSFGNLSWSSTEPSGTGITMKVRTDSSSDMSGATAWASCTTVTSGADITSNGCVTDGHRYVQYQATLTTTESSNTPQLEDVSIQYNSYTNGSLLGTPFDSESAGNVMGSMQWTESGTGDVQFQIRTAPDSGSAPDWANGSGWCGPSNCAATTGDTDYAASYHTTGAGSDVYSSQAAGENDQWFQYKLWLTSADGATTPTVSDATVVYVVNAPPDFTGSVTSSQDTAGIVYINYSVRDTDSTSGSATPGYVTPSFQYSLDNGDNWNNITTGLSTNATSTSANATTTKAVDESTYNSYTVAWTPNEQINSYTTTAKIKVIADDSEGANNTASSTTSAFTMDAKAPVAGSPSIFVIATTSPATLHFSATDDTALDMCITLDNAESNCSSYAVDSTLALATDPDTAYVKFRDAYGNITSASAVTPETPYNMIIRDLSNVSADPIYRLFVSWAAVTDPTPGFGNYRVWHSTDGTTYTLLSSISDRTINYILHDGLTNDGNTHYYKIATEDSDGNVSYFSNIVSDLANGQGGTDASPPTISSVSIDSINTQSAVVTWTTDELSDSTVGYSTVAADFDTEVGVATMLTAHTVTMTGLTPGTKYYLQAKSLDPDSNTGTDNNGGDGYYFTTLSGPAVSNVSASTVQNTTATVTWNTDIAAGSTVYYSTSSDLSSPMNTGDATEVTEHSVTISDLTAGTRYYFYVVSGVAIDNNAGDYYSLNTTSDGTAPVITSVANAIITDDDAVVTWTTDEGATSQVYYGLSTGTYASSTTETSVYNTSHSVTMTPLANNTIYYYAVTSADSAGNRSTSTEGTLTTLEALTEETEVTERESEARESGAASVICSGGGGSTSDSTAPVISNVNIDTADSGEVGLTWETNEFAMSLVYYGADSIEENVIADPNSISGLTKTHGITLDGLLSETEYKYKVVSIDSFANVGESEEATFSSGSFLSGIDDSEGIGDASQESFLKSVEQATIFFERMSTQVSLSTLEGGIATHIDDLSAIVPPPIIAGEPVVTVGSNSVAIEWVTEQEANASVAYATEAYYIDSENEYAQTIGDPDLYLAGIHRVSISGLTPETNYHYKIISEKKVGSRAESKDFTFTTIPESAEIESYTADIVSTEEASFKWVTTVPTDSQVRYTPYREGILSVEEARTEKNDSYTTIHNILVEEFEVGVIYQIDLLGETQGGRVVSQTISSFATADDNLAPSISQVRTESALSIGKQTKVQTIISWQSNELATAKVYYQQGVGVTGEDLAQSTPNNDIYAKHHVAVITEFNPGAIYSFQVENTDTEGNSSRSRTYTILTPKQTESVFQVIMGNVEDTFGWLKF
ncbi:hypothetical protein HON36_01275 [Candidatus Parcubacteria bacterium]|nr:hypothetical protein [Candidatus Parcubacteria bacterium]